MLFLLSYVRRCARLESNQRACRIRALLSTELRASVLGFLTRRCVPVGEWDSVGSHGPLAGGCAAAQGGEAAAGQGSERASGRNRTRTPAVQRACAAVDTTEAKVEMAGVEPAPPRCKRGALPPELHPQVRTDGVEPPQPEAPRLQRGELTRAQRPRTGVADRIRTDASGITTPGASRYTTATM
jgi:hypothetical protein